MRVDLAHPALKFPGVLHPKIIVPEALSVAIGPKAPNFNRAKRSFAQVGASFACLGLLRSPLSFAQ